MATVHRYKSDEGDFLFVSEKTTKPLTTPIRITEYVGKLLPNEVKKVLKLEEENVSDKKVPSTVEASKAATVANVLRKFAQDLEEK